jgi:steroid delta-isomerase-like uncharacterized protein
MSRSEQPNKALVRRYVEEIWNSGRLDAMERYVADEYVFAPPDGAPPIRGPEGLRRHVATLRDAIHGLHMTIEQMVAEGDVVAWSWTMTGRHAGAGLGAPSGRQIQTRGVAIYRIRGERIVERDGEADALGLLQQLGLLPSITQLDGDLRARPGA